MPEAVADLVSLVVEALCFALVWCIRILALAILDVLAASVGHVPFLGDALKGAVNSVAQAGSSALGRVENGLGVAIGASWHALAWSTDETWHLLKESALGYAAAGELLARVVYAHSGLKSLVQGHAHAQDATAAKVKTLEKEYVGIEHKVKQLERDVSRGIGHDVLPRLGQLEKEAARIETVELPAAEAATQQAQSAIDNLYDWAKGKASLLGVGTFSFAVAAALSALGLAGLSCTNFKNLLGKFGCGLGTLLNDLLGIMVSVVALEAVCDYLPYIEDAFGAVVGPMVHILNEVPLGSCEIPDPSWATFPTFTASLPPAQARGTLAA